MNQSTTIYYLSSSSGIVYPIDVNNEIIEQLRLNNEINSLCLDMPNIQPFPDYNMRLVMHRHLFESERAALCQHQRNLATRVSLALNRAALTGVVTDHLHHELPQITDTTTLYKFERMLGFYYIERVEVPTLLVPFISNTKLMYTLDYPIPLYQTYQQVTNAIVEDYLNNQELRRTHDLPAVELRTFNRWE